MSLFTVCTRFLRRYILSAESLFCIILVVIIYNMLVNIHPLWQKAKNVKLRFSTSNGYKQEVDVTQQDDTTDYWSGPEGSNNVSWQMTSGPAAVYSIQGRRPHMEDRFNIRQNAHYSLYAIFDGHGGDFCAEYSRRNLLPAIVTEMEADDDAVKDHVDHKQILTKHVLDIDEQLLKLAKQNYDISGSTALIALVTDSTLTVANVGDSRGVMCDKDGNAIPLSEDHKPNLAKERKRIQEAGGFVAFNGVWRVAGILATSRALGDYLLKDKNFLTAEPDILTFDLKEVQPQFIILATDGLWDCFTNDEAVEYIKDRLDEPHYGAKSLLLQAYYRGSLDNITVMIVKFDSKKSYNDVNVNR